MARAGAKPRSCTTDVGLGFQGPVKQALKASGIEVYTKRKEDINSIATIDTAIGYLKKKWFEIREFGHRGLSQ